ncbi:MAG: excinuclease ABC subunit C, partial [Deltaproteobacteria bacterium]|nr:excinuclease ABC subunit C [Deltaproteobacteria bacterium]
KEADRLFIPGRKNPLPLSRAARFLLMRLRDETHRRAITAHRKARSKSLTASQLLDIPGLGPKRTQALLKHLGSVKAVRAAGVEELARTPGLSRTLAEKIRAYFQAASKTQAPTGRTQDH